MDNKKLFKLIEEMDAFIQEEMSEILNIIIDIELLEAQIQDNYDKAARKLKALEPFRSRVDNLYKDEYLKLEKVRNHGN